MTMSERKTIYHHKLKTMKPIKDDMETKAVASSVVAPLPCMCEPLGFILGATKTKK